MSFFSVVIATVLFLFWFHTLLYWHTIILILIDVQYSQTTIFSFEKCSNRQNHSFSGSHHPLKNSPQQCSLLFDKKWGKFCNFMLKLRLWTLANQYIVNQITRPFHWTTHCIVLFFSMQHFGKLGVNLNGLVVKVLDYQSRSPMFKTIGCI